MPRLKRSVSATLGAATLALTCGGHAGGILLPVGAGGAAAGPQRTELAPDVRERVLRIDRQNLSSVRDDVESAGAGRLLLNVADGAHLEVVVERSAPTRWGYSLSGRVAGSGVGFVTLVVHEEAVAGSIWTPKSEYELAFLGDGTHALRNVTNVTNEPAAQCSGTLPRAPSAASAVSHSRTDDGSVVSVVDILVVWTPAAEEYYGGEPQVLSRIEMLVAYTNDAFERSGALVALNLVGAEKVDYSESGRHSASLRSLVDPDDGQMDRVHDRRDTLGADLIYLLSAWGGGRAQVLGPYSVGAGTPRIFAHEVGHNFGVGHERHEFIGTRGPATHGHGFTTMSCDQTIMSFGTECYGGAYRPGLPFYASPWRYSPIDGRALGVTRFSKVRGARGPAEAVLTLNRNRDHVANYRPRRSVE